MLQRCCPSPRLQIFRVVRRRSASLVPSERIKWQLFGKPRLRSASLLISERQLLRKARLRSASLLRLLWLSITVNAASEVRHSFLLLFSGYVPELRDCLPLCVNTMPSPDDLLSVSVQVAEAPGSAGSRRGCTLTTLRQLRLSHGNNPVGIGTSAALINNPSGVGRWPGDGENGNWRRSRRLRRRLQ